MNQAQRKFLIDKIRQTVENKIRELRDDVKESDCPSLNLYLLHLVLGNKFDIKPIESIKEVIKRKALKANDREDWLGNSWGSGNKGLIHFDVRDIFVVPEDFQNKLNDYKRKKSDIEDKINNLRIQADTLITRIQLASDKTLQTMINEVDDMGNISLMETKLKLLNETN